MTREHPAYYELGYGEDFGLSALTERLSRPGHATGPAAAFALAEELADRSEGEEAVELGEDARRLLASGLPERVLHTVWLASTGNAFDPARHGMTTRAWLERISEVSTARLRQNKASYTPPPVRPVRDARLCRAVVAELRVTAPALVAASPPPHLVDCLEQVVNGADADLGMRLLLRALKAHSVPVPYGQYRRMVALGWQFGFPPGAVHDGLAITWPPVSTDSREGLQDDFGLSRLARQFTAGWHHRTPRAAVAAAVQADGYERPPGSEAAVLLEDTRRVLGSGLSDDTITVLWLAATDRGHNIDRFGISGREWLEQVSEVCREHLTEVAPAYVPAARPPATGAGEVLREIRDVSPLAATATVSPGFHPLEGTTVVEALEQIATQVDPDLGFRLLLRLVEVLRLPLTEEQYTRYEALAGSLHYGEDHLLFSVYHLVQRT
ncbi:contact-dependent growth inhibition system immunity protein [Streptomyces erythrochromogenes]|uniref:contact-dependent growth inhibition system immunity protein n=1 Tax=Streptomyces erythrochromogenes TaxID=285574 RepID=UPI0036BB06CD